MYSLGISKGVEGIQVYVLLTLTPFILLLLWTNQEQTALPFAQVSLLQELVSFALQSCLSPYTACEQPLATVWLHAAFTTGSCCAPGPSGFCWDSLRADLSPTNPPRGLLTPNLLQNSLSIYSHCSLLTSIFVPGDPSTEEGPCRLNTCPWNLSAPFLSSLMRTFWAWAEPVLLCAARCCIVPLAQGESKQLGLRRQNS